MEGWTDRILKFFGTNLPLLFTKYGWQASLIVIVVVVALALGAVVVLRQIGVL